MPVVLRAVTLLLTFCSLNTVQAQTSFRIKVFREKASSNLVTGTLVVNNMILGRTYENEKLMIREGTYNGKLRYVSTSGHAVGPLGSIGHSGDFLLEVGDVTWSDGRKRKDLLFHGGNKPQHSKGCVMLGSVSRDKDGKRYLPEGHTLSKLRKEFYGTEPPTSSPNKAIRIEIVDLYRYQAEMHSAGPSKDKIQKLVRLMPTRVLQSNKPSKSEADRILQFLTAKKIYSKDAHSVSGHFGSDTEITMWVGTYGKNDRYGVRYGNRDGKYIGSNSSYFEIDSSLVSDIQTLRRPQAARGKPDKPTESSAKQRKISNDAFIAHGDMGGPEIMISTDGTALQSNNKSTWVTKGSWSLNGNRLKFKLKSKSGGYGISFDGVQSKEVVLKNGKRIVYFSGTKVHFGGNNPRSRAGSVRLYPDGGD